MIKNAKDILTNIVENAILWRSELFNKSLDPRRDIDKECGYPATISKGEYRYVYDREGVAKRVVHFWPSESWSMDPEVSEDDDQEETAFEEAWVAIQKKHNLYHYLERVDAISGIGRFGILLLGLSDGANLNQEVPGVTSEAPAAAGSLELLYVRTFDENVVTVDQREDDLTSARYQQPTMYSITIREGDDFSRTAPSTGTSPASGGTTSRELKVHWTRVIHIADNRGTSEVYGVPRLQDVYNRILDLRKVLAGSGEMFWKGAFPGMALEVDPSVTLSDDDVSTMREEFSNYANGLQRFMAFTGVGVKSLAVQVADPSNHLEGIMNNIALSMDVPRRKFFGSEQAQLASEQDTRTWNGRVKRRQEKYVVPMIIRVLIDRLIAIGLLPPVEEYEVEFPDLNTATDAEKAEVADKRTTSLAKYVTAGVDVLIPPPEYLKLVQGFDQDEIDAIIAASEARTIELDEEQIAADDLQLEQDITRETQMRSIPPAAVAPSVSE